MEGLPAVDSGVLSRVRFALDSRVSADRVAPAQSAIASAQTVQPRAVASAQSVSCIGANPAGSVGVDPYAADVTRPERTLDLHIASWTPSRWDEVEEIRRGQNPAAWRGKGRPVIASEDLDWLALGLTPRWLDDDSSEAVAALDPSLLHDGGANEWRRMLTGAATRGELVLAVSMVGSDEEPGYVPLGGLAASVYLPAATWTSVGGTQIALRSRPDPAPGLGRADRDLALRIADTRPPELPWWRLSMSGSQTLSPFDRPAAHAAEGTLESLLVSRAGETVAAVWTSPGGAVRHYVLPFMPAWRPVLEWLMQQAIPEFIPTAARRVRSSLAVEPELQTPAEADARGQLAQLESDYEAQRTRLETELTEAQRRADDVRDPLLFGSGTPLVTAVARVLADAGIEVQDVDEMLGDTSNADLLVDYAGRRLLVEVKSCGGPAGERLAEAPGRHLSTWPQLRPDLPVDGIVLVLNHQTKTHPLDRDAEPYRRPEFVESLQFPVVTTRQLFYWWRAGDHETLRVAVMGTRKGVSATGRPTQTVAIPGRRKRWPFGQR